MIIYMGLIYITLTFILFEFQFSTVSVIGQSFKIPMLAVTVNIFQGQIFETNAMIVV